MPAPVSDMFRFPMDFVPGALVAGRYRLKRLVGAGGMGEVWSGDDAKTGTRVAVKRLLPAAAKHHEVIARFRREAYLLGRIGSEYAAKVIDFLDDETYGLVLAMDFIDGPSLAHVLEDRTLSIEESLDLAADILHALVDLHAAKIVHRDLKPGNIIMRPLGNGRSRGTIVDFGISRLLAGADRGAGDGEVTGITRANIALGTVEYMAPEQILNSRDVTPVTDLYAVGIILFRSVKGHHAFGDRRGEELARAKLIEEAPALDTGRRDAVAEGFSAFVQRALKKRPAQRFQSAESMLEEVERLQTLAGVRRVQMDAPDTDADLDDSTTDSGKTAVKPSPLSQRETVANRGIVPAAGAPALRGAPRAQPIDSSARQPQGARPQPPQRTSNPPPSPSRDARQSRAPVQEAVPIRPAPSAEPSAITRATDPRASDPRGAFGDARASIPDAPLSQPTGRASIPEPRASMPEPRPSLPDARGSLPSLPHDSGQHARVSMPVGLVEHAPSSARTAQLAMADMPTVDRASAGLSKGTVALAVVTAFAVGVAVGLVIAPSGSSSRGVATERATSVATATAVATNATIATVEPVATVVPAPSDSVIELDDTPPTPTAHTTAKPAVTQTAKPVATLTGKLPATAWMPPTATATATGGTSGQSSSSGAAAPTSTSTSGGQTAATGGGASPPSTGAPTSTAAPPPGDFGDGMSP